MSYTKVDVRNRLKERAGVEFARYKGESNRLCDIHDNQEFWEIWDKHADWLKKHGFGLQKRNVRWWVVDYIFDGKYPDPN